MEKDSWNIKQYKINQLYKVIKYNSNVEDLLGFNVNFQKYSRATVISQYSLARRDDNRIEKQSVISRSLIGMRVIVRFMSAASTAD
jgi:NDP-sugar pyrophosphorylase family protein